MAGELPTVARPALEELLHEQIEELLSFFDFEQLPQHLQSHSRPFHALAHDLAGMTMWSFELIEALRNLLRAKDAAVRALVLERRQHQQAVASKARTQEPKNDG